MRLVRTFIWVVRQNTLISTQDIPIGTQDILISTQGIPIGTQGILMQPKTRPASLRHGLP
jgi:hypothetical protein